MRVEILKEWSDDEFFKEFWDISETINPVTNEKSEQQWLNLWKVKENNPDVDFIICIGDNSLGKTYSVEQGFCQQLLLGEKQNWIRNLRTESGRCIDSWSSVMRRNNLQDKYEVTANGIYEKTINTNGKSKKPKLGDLVLPFVYMSSPDSSTAPIEGLVNNCWDEFLSGNEKRKFVIKEPLKALRKLEKRNRAMYNTKKGNVVTFLLANPHTPEADILSDLYCDWDWVKPYNNENLYTKYKTILDDGSDGVVVIFTMIINIENVKNEFLQKQLARDKKMGISGYEFPHPSLKKIYLKPEGMEILMSITFDAQSFTFYYCKEKDIIWVGKYVKGAEAYPSYCVFQSDQNGTNTYIPRDKDVYDTFIELLSYRLNNRIWYQQPFVYEELKHFFEYLETIRQTEENDS